MQENQNAVGEEFVEQGRQKIRWAELHLPLLQNIREQFRATRPFAELTIGMCIHVEAKTAVLCLVLQAGGARIVLTGSPGTTQDDVVAALKASGVIVFGQRQDNMQQHQVNVRQVLQHEPHLLLDNGADLVSTLLTEYAGGRVFAATEETTTGANRLREVFHDKLSFPIIVINDSPLKLLIENEHGVGPTTVESFMRTTNLLVRGRRFAVFGYGSVGRGLARCLRALAAQVTVVEPDPIRALEALLDGMQVVPFAEALSSNEVCITATGRPGVIAGDAFDLLPSGVILANIGHFSWEIDLAELRQRAVKVERLSDHIELFTLENGKQITLLAQGELLNIAAGNGNPVEVMDLGFALQAESLAYLARCFRELPPGPQPVPGTINREVAQRMVEQFASRPFNSR